VIRVQVSVHHGVDLLGREARLGEALEKWPAPLVPERQRSLLPVAHARVDEHLSPAGLDHERLHAQRDTPALVREVGHQPAVARDVGGLRLRKEELGRNAVSLVLEHARQRARTDSPALELHASGERYFRSPGADSSFG
jgi:hypothetical protein